MIPYVATALFLLFEGLWMLFSDEHIGSARIVISISFLILAVGMAANDIVRAIKNK